MNFSFQSRFWGLSAASFVCSFLIVSLTYGQMLLLGAWENSLAIFEWSGIAWGTIMISFIGLLIAFPVCQIVGHPIWWAAQKAGLSGPKSALLFGATGGALAGLIFSVFDGVATSYGIVVYTIPLGLIAGWTAFKVAQHLELRNA